jgi:hypothetical protein
MTKTTTPKKQTPKIKEKDVQTIFGKFNKINGAFELKLCKSTSIRYDSVKPHQRQGLKDIQNKGLYHKISDSPWTQKFTSKKPFDCFYLSDIPAYVVVCLYTLRKPKIFCYIPILIWEEAEIKSDRKSINREEIISIAHYVLQLS